MEREIETTLNKYTDQMRKLANDLCFMQATWKLWLLSEEKAVVVGSHWGKAPEGEGGNPGAYWVSRTLQTRGEVWVP